MFASLSSRVAALGAVVVVPLLLLAVLLIDASRQTRESFQWVAHSAAVIETMDDALGDLREAESGQRGFVLTHDSSFAQNVARRIGEARRGVAKVVALTADNPVQHTRAKEIARLVDQRIAILKKPLALGQRRQFDRAAGIIANGRGRDVMLAVGARAQGLLDEERALQSDRVARADRKLERVRRLALVGGPLIALLVGLVTWFIIRGIRRPLDTVLAAMSDLGDGDRRARVAGGMGSREFARLARSYNEMADRLEAAVADQALADVRLSDANEELRRNGDALRERGEVIELLGGMAHRMQAARTDEELASIIRVFVPRVLPGISGALYAHNNSRNLLVPVADWGGFTAEVDGFPPDQCWALRRGQSHFVDTPGGDIVCAHVGHDHVYHCEPLLAGGEVIGVLYLNGMVGEESRFRLTVLTENIASALVNHRLQRGLREQTIRDPLTGLFNRRYMEETLTLEIARSLRSGQPLSLVMCDVDHFKRFNDEFGHDAGDTVLQAVASEMRSRFRDGDVVCRFGGEEFTIIAPDSTAAALAGRVELVRQAICDLKVRQGGLALGATSMSFGIATWHPSMPRDGSALIQAADAALYQAKREGRNRAVLDLRAAA